MTSSLRYFENNETGSQYFAEPDARNDDRSINRQQFNKTATSSSEFELSLYSELATSGDIKDFYNRILNIINSYGFSDFGFVRGDCVGNEFPLVTNPRKQIDVYFESGFYEHDFLEHYRQINPKPVFFSSIYQYAIDAPFDIDCFRVNREISELNKSFGFFDYYYIFIKSSHGNENVMLAVSCRGLDPIGFQKYIVGYKSSLQLLCEAIDYISVSKFSENFLDPKQDKAISITPQPLRVLSALANNDLSITQLADKLFISPITAHQHITAARKALDAKTNVGAIKKAIKLGLITYD